MRSRTPFVLSVGLLIGALLTGMAVNTSAAVPQLINFQGILVDGGGNPVTTTTSVLFTIWNRAMSGIPVWSETQSITPGADGSFSVLLGSVTPVTDVAFSDSAFLSIKVDTDPEMSPRIYLVSVPYAYRTRSVDDATGGDIFGDLRIHSTLQVGDMSGDVGRIEVTDGSAVTITLDGTFGNLTALGRATIGPGNTNTGLWAFVAGQNNTVSGDQTTVGGGIGNTASGNLATVGGGGGNSASEFSGTVAGGNMNTATGTYAAVPGGQFNTASGSFSFAAGRRAKANHDGAFVWGDDTNSDITSTKTDQFTVRAANGLRLVTNANPSEFVDVGERFRDNAIVAWGKVSSAGTLTQEFGVGAVVRNSTGNYTVLINATAGTASLLIPIAQAEVESQGTIRIVSINQTGPQTFDVYINNSSFNAVDNDFVFMVTAR